MKEQIPDDLILLIHNNFMVSLDVLREKQDCSLLSPQIGLQPRDLMMLILLIEEKFNIFGKFSRCFGTTVIRLKIILALKVNLILKERR